MKLVQYFMKEASLQLAIIVLGALLLVSFWITKNVNTNILKDYKHDRVSVILDDGIEDRFRNFAESNSNILRFEIHQASENKQAIRAMYPELSGVLSSLEDGFFPSSATLTVRDSELVKGSLSDQLGLTTAQTIHRPPARLKQFLSAMTVTFSGLWILALIVVLYFQLDRLAYRESRRWSLLKMLGAKPIRVFWPLCAGQVSRIAIASFLAVGCYFLVTREFEAVFQWNWESLSMAAWIAFIFMSIAIGGVVFLTLFLARFRRVSLG